MQVSLVLVFNKEYSRTLYSILLLLEEKNISELIVRTDSIQIVFNVRRVILFFYNHFYRHWKLIQKFNLIQLSRFSLLLYY